MYIVNLLASSNTVITLISYMNSISDKFTNLPRETSLNLSKIHTEASVVMHFNVKIKHPTIITIQILCAQMVQWI